MEARVVPPRLVSTKCSDDTSSFIGSEEFQALLDKLSREYGNVTTQCAMLQAQTDALLAASQATPSTAQATLLPSPQSLKSAPAQLEDVNVSFDGCGSESRSSSKEAWDTDNQVLEGECKPSKRQLSDGSTTSTTSLVSHGGSRVSLGSQDGHKRPSGAHNKNERAQFNRLVLKEKQEAKANERFRCAFVKGKHFSVLSASLIVINSVYIGITTNFMVRSEIDRLDMRPVPDLNYLRFGDAFFCFFFSCELLFRMMADRLQFITGREQKWNCFDFIVVAFSWLDLLTQFVKINIGLRLSFFRVVRIVRILRVLRVASHSPIIQGMKTMLYSIGGTSTSFISAMFLLFAVMYIAALLFLGGILNHLADMSVDDTGTKGDSWLLEVKDKYGSIEGTIWTLFASVTGGHDWAGPAATLCDMGFLYTWAFLGYIAFALFVVLNIMNGIFVNVAMQASNMNRQLAIDAAMKKRENMISEMVDIFLEAGVDDLEPGEEGESNGDHVIKVSWEQFQERLCDEGMKAYFMALDLDMASLHKIFILLDTQQSGKLDLEVFINGCIRLQGSAKMVDISTLESISENTHVHILGLEQTIRLKLDHFDKHIESVDSRMVDIDKHMTDVDEHLFQKLNRKSWHRVHGVGRQSL